MDATMATSRPSLEQRVLTAIFEIGLSRATPNQLHIEISKELPSESGVGKPSVRHVKSHIQKYRSNVQKSRKRYYESWGVSGVPPVADILAKHRKPGEGTQRWGRGLHPKKYGEQCGVTGEGFSHTLIVPDEAVDKNDGSSMPARKVKRTSSDQSDQSDQTGVAMHDSWDGKWVDAPSGLVKAVQNALNAANDGMVIGA